MCQRLFEIRGFEKLTFKTHLTHKIWQRRFGRVKGALLDPRIENFD